MDKKHPELNFDPGPPPEMKPRANFRDVDDFFYKGYRAPRFYEKKSLYELKSLTWHTSFELGLGYDPSMSKQAERWHFFKNDIYGWTCCNLYLDWACGWGGHFWYVEAAMAYVMFKFHLRTIPKGYVRMSWWDYLPIWHFF